MVFFYLKNDAIFLSQSYETELDFSRLEQAQISRSLLSEGVDFWDCFGREKNL